MLGFRTRINLPDDQPGDPKIEQHRIAVVAGLFLLGIGLWSALRYFHIQPPPDASFQQVPLQEVLNVTETSYPFSSNEIESIELHTENRVVEFEASWPCFDRVHRCDTNLTLLVDATNRVWLVKDAGGAVFGRTYFQKHNLEAKSVSGAVAVLFIPLGAFLFLPSLILEIRSRRQGKSPQIGPPVSARKFSIFVSELAYMYAYFFLIVPLLSKILPSVILAIIWVISGAGIAKLILRYFEKQPGKPVNTEGRPLPGSSKKDQDNPTSR